MTSKIIMILLYIFLTSCGLNPRNNHTFDGVVSPDEFGVKVAFDEAGEYSSVTSEFTWDLN
tara:strand:+ start:3121 stop:3303 length:183 start_codon:yes stop_codon:yes gene_type:complete